MQPDEGKQLLKASAPASSAGSTASPSLNGAGHEPGGGKKTGTKPGERDKTPGMVLPAQCCSRAGAAGYCWCIHWPLLLHRGATPKQCSPQCLLWAQGAVLPALEEEQSPNLWTVHVTSTRAGQRAHKECGNSKVPACPCSKSKVPLDNTSFPVTPEQSRSWLSPSAGQLEVQGGLSLGRAPGEQSLCPSLCQRCLLLDLKCHLLTPSLVLLLPPHRAVPSAMEVLVSAQAPWPPPDSRGLVHPWMGSRWTTLRLSWLPLCCARSLVCMLVCCACVSPQRVPPLLLSLP